MLVILVGAMIVASIETVWHEVASPYRKQSLQTYDLSFAKGDEIGRFLLGSTVICCFPKGAVDLHDNWLPATVVRMGEEMGRRC